MKKIYIILFGIFVFNNLNAQFLKKINIDRGIHLNPELQSKSGTKKLYLNKANGCLSVNGLASKSPYEVYFIVPIAFREQAPIWFEIQCPNIVDYRFVRLDQFNVFVAARLNNSIDNININWTSWVLAKQHDYSGIPISVPIPTFNNLPDSVKPWLKPTGCVQWSDPYISHIADSVRGTTNNLIVLANKIRNYCYSLPCEFPVEPVSFDAFYAMKWGNSCTGLAHAGAALFRSNGIPSRVLMNMPSWYTDGNFDMHWAIEYYVPQYGWVKMETTLGSNPYINGHSEVITFACNPEDEFSMTFPDNIESYWFTSDTVFQHFYPNWGRSHSCSQNNYIIDNSTKVDSIISLTDSIYKYFANYQGIRLTNMQNTYFQLAQEFQQKAYIYIKSSKKDSTIYYLTQSLDNYRKIASNPTHTIYFDNFENGKKDWSHGGINDEWEIGTPTNVGPSYTYSGNNCWGTDLDSLYKNNVDCWLMSPSINLNNLSCAYLNVKIWNDLEDSLQSFSPKDKLWIEASTDNGITFFPITTCLGGVIDYNTGIPKIGGWSRLVLDLTPYINTTLKIRFHFTSNSSKTEAGSYIDDFHIYGREMNIDNVYENTNINEIICYPNPVSGKLTIEALNFNEAFSFSLINLNGQELFHQQINENKAQIDISNLSNGVYFLKFITKNIVQVKKIIIE